MKNVTYVTAVGSAFIYTKTREGYKSYLGTPTSKGTFRKQFHKIVTAEEAQVEWARLEKNGAKLLG